MIFQGKERFFCQAEQKNKIRAPHGTTERFTLSAWEIVINFSSPNVLPFEDKRACWKPLREGSEGQAVKRSSYKHNFFFQKKKKKTKGHLRVFQKLRQLQSEL